MTSNNAETNVMQIEPMPTTPCIQCLNDPTRQAHGADGAMIVVHCLHHMAGGVFRPALGKWTVVSPVNAEEFADYCVRLGALHVQVVAIEDGGDPAAALN